MLEGGKVLRRKVNRYKPKILAVLGLGAYRAAFDEPKAQIGRQDKTIGATILWALPNPSGLNAHYQREQLAALFAELKAASDLLHSGKTF